MRIARGTSLPEITVLLRASASREKGLTLLRAGNTAQGAELLGEARRIFSEAVLSEEARMAAKSLSSIPPKPTSTSDVASTLRPRPA